MIKQKKKEPNQKNLIIVIALILAGLGYLGYRSMLTSPDINKVTTPERRSKTPPPKSGKVITPTATPKNTQTPKYSSAPTATPRR